MTGISGAIGFNVQTDRQVLAGPPPRCKPLMATHSTGTETPTSFVLLDSPRSSCSGCERSTEASPRSSHSGFEHSIEDPGGRRGSSFQSTAAGGSCDTEHGSRSNRCSDGAFSYVTGGSVHSEPLPRTPERPLFPTVCAAASDMMPPGPVQAASHPMLAQPLMPQMSVPPVVQAPAAALLGRSQLCHGFVPLVLPPPTHSAQQQCASTPGAGSPPQGGQGFVRFAPRSVSPTRRSSITVGSASVTLNDNNCGQLSHCQRPRLAGMVLPSPCGNWAPGNTSHDAQWARAVSPHSPTQRMLHATVAVPWGTPRTPHSPCSPLPLSSIAAATRGTVRVPSKVAVLPPGTVPTPLRFRTSPQFQASRGGGSLSPPRRTPSPMMFGCFQQNPEGSETLLSTFGSTAAAAKGACTPCDSSSLQLQQQQQQQQQPPSSAEDACSTLEADLPEQNCRVGLDPSSTPPSMDPTSSFAVLPRRIGSPIPVSGNRGLQPPLRCNNNNDESTSMMAAEGFSECVLEADELLPCLPQEATMSACAACTVDGAKSGRGSSSSSSSGRAGPPNAQEWLSADVPGAPSPLRPCRQLSLPHATAPLAAMPSVADFCYRGGGGLDDDDACPTTNPIAVAVAAAEKEGAWALLSDAEVRACARAKLQGEVAPGLLRKLGRCHLVALLQVHAAECPAAQKRSSACPVAPPGRSESRLRLSPGRAVTAASAANVAHGCRGTEVSRQGRVGHRSKSPPATRFSSNSVRSVSRRTGCFLASGANGCDEPRWR